MGGLKCTSSSAVYSVVLWILDPFLLQGIHDKKVYDVPPFGTLQVRENLRSEVIKICYAFTPEQLYLYKDLLANL